MRVVGRDRSEQGLSRQTTPNIPGGAPEQDRIWFLVPDPDMLPNYFIPEP